MAEKKEKEQEEQEDQKNQNAQKARKKLPKTKPVKNTDEMQKPVGGRSLGSIYSSHTSGPSSGI